MKYKMILTSFNSLAASTSPMLTLHQLKIVLKHEKYHWVKRMLAACKHCATPIRAEIDGLKL